MGRDGLGDTTLHPPDQMLREISQRLVRQSATEQRTFAEGLRAMSTKVLSKHLAGNIKFSLPNNPVSNYWATLYSCSGHALHKGAVLHKPAFAHYVCIFITTAFQQMAVECLIFNDISI